MVIIVSESTDASTNFVIDWISYYKKKILRLNRDDFFDNNSHHIMMELSPNNSWPKLKILGHDISSEMKSIWFRRSSYFHLGNDLLSEIKEETTFTDVKKNFYYEYLNSSMFFYSCLEKGKKTLGNFRRGRLNKIEVLNLARENGIDIPSTIITNKKQDVKIFLKEHKFVITKAISEIFGIKVTKNDEIEYYMNYTEEISDEIFASMPDFFSPSLFQEKLDKDIEIRTFFLDGICYSMAIFSQLETQTSTDFRKYSKNRNVPYQLPKELEEKIKMLMLAIELNTGSIDFVKTNDGRYVFLEVNPTGQYGMTSDPCNYQLDKKIAEYLISYE